MDKWEQEFCDKFDSGVKITKRDIETLVYEFKVEIKYGDNRRWSRSATTISQVGDRYFSTEWDNGLTENQDDEFYYQPIEVKKHTYKKLITITDWISIKAIKDCALTPIQCKKGE